jgi:general secretion pathway protein G
MKLQTSLKSERGLTLIEIIVVLIILSLVMTFLGGRIFGAGDQARADITRLQLQDIKSSIEQFRLRYSTLPNSLDSLVGCNEQTGPGCNPIMSNPESLKDAWGNPFVYTLQDGGRRYRVTSLGADGREGGEGVDYDVFIEGP